MYLLLLLVACRTALTEIPEDSGSAVVSTARKGTFHRADQGWLVD